MKDQRTDRWWTASRWTLAFFVAMALLNWGLVNWAPEPFRRLLTWMEYDREAILNGQLWRIVTGNFVHWSPAHFFLDVGAFLIVGLLFERYFGRFYPGFLLGTAAAIGLSIVLLEPGLTLYRGLSGVDSGQFLLALGIEMSLARRDRHRWFWVAPAAGIFLVKIIFECATGQLFFGTSALGDVGAPTAIAHAAGALCGLGFLSFRIVSDTRSGLTREQKPAPTAH